MKTLTLTTTTDQDYELVVKLAQRLGLEYHEETLAAPAEVAKAHALPDISRLSREEKLAILRRGGSGTSIPDPLAWQRAERDWDERLTAFRK